MDKWRKQFPVLSHSIYANTAAMGLFYEDLQEWRQEYDLDCLIGNTQRKSTKPGIIEQTRAAIGSFFTISANRVALVPNFSIGFNLLLDGLDSNRKVLLLEEEYPSVNWPFESRNFSITYTKVGSDVEASIREALQGSEISILALSLVQWTSGIRIAPDFFKQLKIDFPELLIIADGTQFCGMETFDFQTSGIDVLGASGYKWLLGGYGNGFMLLREGVDRFFTPHTIGYGSTKGNFAEKDNLSLTGHLEPGHLDPFNFGSLLFSLQFLETIGMDAITAQNKRLSKKAKEVFESLNLLDDCVVKREQHSTIFNIKGDTNLCNRLLENDVICVQRGAGIRLSFHWYNTEEDVDRIAQILSKND